MKYKIKVPVESTLQIYEDTGEREREEGNQRMKQNNWWLDSVPDHMVREHGSGIQRNCCTTLPTDP